MDTNTYRTTSVRAFLTSVPTDLDLLLIGQRQSGRTVLADMISITNQINY